MNHNHVWIFPLIYLYFLDGRVANEKRKSIMIPKDSGVDVRTRSVFLPGRT